MDGQRFDAMARTLARAPDPEGPRRASRRGFLGGLAGLTAAFAGGRVAGAQCPPGRVNRRGVGCVCRHTGRLPAGDCCTDAECGAPATCGGGGTAQTCGCAPTTVLVSSLTSTLTDTGVFLAAGSTVSVTASGSITYCTTPANSFCPTGPNGDTTLVGPTCDVDVAFPCGQLVGVIGGGNLFADTDPFDPGPFFTVGSGPTAVTAGADGNLFLQIVDASPPQYADNVGSYSVTISCETPSL